MSPWISVFFGKSKVNNIHQTALLSKSHQKIVWFDVPMYEVFTMHILYSADLCNKKEKKYNKKVCYSYA